MLKPLLPVLLLYDQFAQQGILQVSVSLKAQFAAESYNRGGGTVRILGKLVDIVLHGLIRIGQNIVQYALFRNGRIRQVLFDSD